MGPSLLTFLLLLKHLSTAYSEGDLCPLDCPHGVECVRGDMDTHGLPWDPVTGVVILHPDLNRDGWKCDCPPGHAGVSCERSFYSCDKDLKQGCYHGGVCLEGFTNQYGDHQFLCDCKDAIENVPGDEQWGPRKARQYVGRYCELPVLDSAKCNGDFNTFCINGGSCRTEGDDIDLRPCECHDDYTGKHCEFQKSQVPDCDLECGDNGVCVLGGKRLTLFEEKLNISPHASFMHCECRQGYIGFNCDIPATPCGSKGDHWCLNGGKCAQLFNGDGTFAWGCDCSEAPDPATGAACEQKATDICPASTKTDPESTHLGFCVNGGVCQVAFGSGEQFCDCPSTLPSGPHCESLTIDIGGQSSITRKSAAPSKAPSITTTQTPAVSPTLSPQKPPSVVVDDRPDPTASPVELHNRDDSPNGSSVHANGNSPPDESSDSSLWLMIGGVAGGVLVLLAGVLTVKRRASSSRADEPEVPAGAWGPSSPMNDLTLQLSGDENDDPFVSAVRNADGDFAIRVSDADII